MTRLTVIAEFLAGSIEAIADGSRFSLLSQKGAAGLPLVAWRLKGGQAYDGEKSNYAMWTHAYSVPGQNLISRTACACEAGLSRVCGDSDHVRGFQSS